MRAVITASGLDGLLEELVRRPMETVSLGAGVRRSHGEIELLLTTDPPPASSVGPDVRAFRLAPTLRGIGHRHWMLYGSQRRGHRDRLELAFNPDGTFSAAWIEDGAVRAVDELFVVGPGLERRVPGADLAVDERIVPRTGAYSRYAGALGGLGSLARLQALDVAIVGDPATGLVREMATAAVRAGVASVALICGPDEATRSCALSLARHLRGCALETRVHALAVERGSLEEASAMARSDVLLVAASDAAVRRSARLVSSAYLRPLVEVEVTPLDRARVALHLPLSCYAAAGPQRDDSIQASPPDARPRRALERFAAAVAFQVVERLAMAEVDASHALVVETTSDGRIQAVRTPAEQPLGVPTRCRACRSFAGAGDLALREGPPGDLR
ncbi:MAG: hypothetical protein AAF726_21310 [Planctomycetota bacterium]